MPAHIDREAYTRLENVDRLRMIEEIQAHEKHDVSAGMFMDAVSWVLDKVPWGNWLWPVNAAQSAINAQKGDSLNEVDEQYARLVGATYKTVEQRPFIVDHWRRQVDLDSDYISVWDNLDGHRLIAVRGTQGTGTDIGEDILVGITGSSTNLIGNQLLQVMADTPQDTVVDLAAHSLGSSLALQSYGNQTIYDRIHETYLFNPAYSPFLRGKTDAYEKDTSVRYFINVKDAVSMGRAGHKAPRNVVYRSDGLGTAAHKLAQWQGHTSYQEPIYHAPPETAVHALKQTNADLFKREFDDAEQIPAEDVRDGSSAVPPQQTAPVFDFGDYDEFNYETL